MTLVPPPPRLAGDYQSDQITLADWIADFYNGTTTLSSPTVNPSSLPTPGSSSIADAQLVANRAYAFAVALNAALAAMNTALGAAHVAGFPLAGIPVTPPV